MSSKPPTKVYADPRISATNIFGKTAEQLREGVPEYSFTEFITLKFHNSALIADQSTPEGEAWAHALRIYLSQKGRGPIWWGHEEEDSSTVRLLVEWSTLAAFEAFKASSAYHGAIAKLFPFLKQPPSSTRFVLPGYSGARENALSSSFLVSSYTALYTWTFPPDLDPTSTITVSGSTLSITAACEYYWRAFAMTALQNESAVSNTAAHGWTYGSDGGADQDADKSRSFIGILRWKDIKGSKEYSQSKITHSWTKGGLRELNGITEPGLTMSHVKFVSLKNGWQGSVLKEYGDLKAPRGLFGKG